MKRLVFISLVLLLIGAGWWLWSNRSYQPLSRNVVIDSLIVHKSHRKMFAYSGGSVAKTFDISLGDNPVGHKQFEGDGKTPEGRYFINAKNPHSGYHKNLGISYPDARDRAYAKQFNRPPGGEVKIHGLKNGYGSVGRRHLLTDWTRGCIAVTNEEVDDLYAHTPVGTPIIIRP